ncbi:hypothetical protein Slin14017_G102830 [Septoria linicola]|nr:hypothetical protein Slin14017_G102830 [Septoria linicola]
MGKSKRKKAAKVPEVASFMPLDSAAALQLRDIGSKKPSADFEVGASALYLTDEERADVEAFRDRYNQYQADSKKRALAKAFRILDLPPEVRVRIYEILFEEEQFQGHSRNKDHRVGHVLAFAITPDIARVCRTFRKECLPLFFASHEFVVPVGTNLNYRGILRKTGAKPRFWADRQVEAVAKRSGVLNFKKPVKDAIRFIGDDAVFRNIKFRVYEAEWWTFNRSLKRWADQYAILQCRITFRRGQLHIDVKEDDWHPALKSKFKGFHHNRTEAEPEDVQVMVDEFRRIVAEIESKEGCKGLKLKDIERMVKVFRLKPPGVKDYTKVE